MNGVLRFNWLTASGSIINWWADDLSRDAKRFVHNEWGRFAVAVDLNRREAQIQFNHPPEHRVIRFSDIADESTRLAFEAVCDTRNGAFAAELLMRAIGRDDLADTVGR